LQAIQQSPESADLYQARAHAHIKAEEYLEAANDASKAIELDPTSVKAFLRRG
jgi:suppressor of G2 allele of SKP1